MDKLESGRIGVREEPRDIGRAGSAAQPSDTPSSSVTPHELAKPEPLVDFERSLLITECPPQFDPQRESLRLSYLLRDLEGRPIELVIRSKAAPEPPVHRRMLAPGETKNGAGKLEWDGKDDSTGKAVSRSKSPFLVELVHDASYRDTASTGVPPSLVHVVEMEDLMFATGRSILMPDGGYEPALEAGRARS